MIGKCVETSSFRPSVVIDQDHWCEKTVSTRLLRSHSLSSTSRFGLANVGLFDSIGEDGLEALQRISIRRTFADGQIIHMQDDDARFLNVIVAGHVRLSYIMEDGSAVLHDVLSRNVTFGEFGILDRSAYADMATAAGRVSLISLPSAALLDLASASPPLWGALRSAVANRFRTYMTLVRDLSLPALPARLARTLIRVADRFDTWTEHEGRRTQVIGAMVTQTDLGLMARGSRGNVNRNIQAWQKTGWIMLKHRSILILDRQALENIALRQQD